METKHPSISVRLKVTPSTHARYALYQVLSFNSPKSLNITENLPEPVRQRLQIERSHSLTVQGVTSIIYPFSEN
jgi:hypothetical protein